MANICMICRLVQVQLLTLFFYCAWMISDQQLLALTLVIWLRLAGCSIPPLLREWSGYGLQFLDDLHAVSPQQFPCFNKIQNACFKNLYLFVWGFGSFGHHCRIIRLCVVWVWLFWGLELAFHRWCRSSDDAIHTLWFVRCELAVLRSWIQRAHGCLETLSASVSVPRCCSCSCDESTVPSFVSTLCWSCWLDTRPLPAVLQPVLVGTNCFHRCRDCPSACTSSVTCLSSRIFETPCMFWIMDNAIWDIESGQEKEFFLSPLFRCLGLSMECWTSMSLLQPSFENCTSVLFELVFFFCWNVLKNILE